MHIQTFAIKHAPDLLLFRNPPRFLVDDEEATLDVVTKEADILTIKRKTKGKKRMVAGKALKPK